MIFLLRFLFLTTAYSFQQQCLFFNSRRVQINFVEGETSIVLGAKGGKTKKKKKKQVTQSGGGFGKSTGLKSGGGFGKKSTGGENDSDESDYAIFPAMEDRVKSTLVPSTAEIAEEAKDLPHELYDRISQIYGFNTFNHPQEKSFGDEELESPASFDELLAVGSSDSTSTPASSDFTDLLKTSSSSSSNTDDFTDLITSATGSSTSQTLTSIAATEQIDISSLPPFSTFRVLHIDPMVLAIDDFFTPEECDRYVDKCISPKKGTETDGLPMKVKSKTVGKDKLAKAQRTSTTWFHHFKEVPELMAKASRLLGLDGIERWEEPQTVRYQQTQKFTWHLDALAPTESVKEKGGQRLATLLVYLTDVGKDNGGATVFRDLCGLEGKHLKMNPKRGSALLFFPAAGGIPNSPLDIRTLHAGEALAAKAPIDKWIAQLWLREYPTYEPTAPPGNKHSAAANAINEFCTKTLQ